MDIYGVTSKGKVRRDNQDAICIKEAGRVKALLVADGMGGHLAGDAASRRTADFFAELFYSAQESVFDEQFIKEAILRINDEILAMGSARMEYKGMGTTLSLCLIHPSLRLLVAHIGDSRVYRFRSGTLAQLTKDQSYVQYLVDKGVLKKEEAADHPYRNMITSAIGMEGVHPQVFETELRAGDLLLLCTDGLSGYVEDSVIQSALDFHGSAEENCRRLVELAEGAGGCDNVSVIVCKVTEEF